MMPHKTTLNLFLGAAVATAACSPNTSTVDSVDSSAKAHERLVNVQTKRYDLTGRTLLRKKYLDERTMRTREVVVDAQTGLETSMEEARAEYKQARIAAYGAMDPKLAKQLKTRDEAVEVVVQLTDKDAKDALAKDGFKLEGSGDRLRVFADRAELKKLAHRAEVKRMSLASARKPLALSNGRDLGQEPLAVAHRAGWGKWINSAIWEPQACILRNHSDFKSIDWQPRPGGSSCSAYSNAGHSTKVAGAFGADRGTVTTTGLFAGKMFDVDSSNSAAEAEMWARKPQLVNASFTITHFDARDIDREAYKNGIFVFNGSGNDASDEANCYAYNSLCVGGYLHKNTIEQFSDDAIALGASYINDDNSGREGPQVVGPYTIARTAGVSTQYTADSGTSFATPAVAALGGLLLSYYPFDLWKKPALMRAVLMASAQAHPIPGQPRIPNLMDSIDDRAGAGAPNGARAMQIVEGDQFMARDVTPDDLGTMAEFHANAGQRVRVVLSWDQCPGYDMFDPELNADFDMIVAGPGNWNWNYNISSVDNYEIVEFVATYTGNYSAYVWSPRWNGCAEEGGAQRVPMAITWTIE